MKEDFPLPPICPYWRRFHQSSVDGWNIPLESRIEQWQRLHQHRPSATQNRRGDSINID